MWEGDIGALPVVSIDGKPLGMITDRDICMAAYTGGRSLRDARVATAMRRELPTCKPNDSLAAAEATMRDNHIRRLPVVDTTERVVGILTLGDLAREAVREIGGRRRQIGGEEVTATLAAIVQPRSSAAMVIAEQR